MKFEKLDINKHELNQVARLIYETDSETLNYYFKDKSSAVERIVKLIKAGNNSTGYENIHVVTEDDIRILGVLVAFTGLEDDFKRDLRAYFKTFNFIDAIKFVIMDMGYFLSLARINKDDFYLSDIAVGESFRGKGIGKFILEKSLELAREKGCNKVVLDVDLENEGAFRLYKRFGFKIFNKKGIRWFSGKRCIYNMEYRLDIGGES